VSLKTRPNPLKKITLADLSLNAVNLKCFGSNPAGFDFIKPINIAIGRNNSGKSTLLDLVECAATPSTFQVDAIGHRGESPLFYCDVPINSEVLEKIRSEAITLPTGGNQPLEVNARNFAETKLLDAKLRCRLQVEGEPIAHSVAGFSSTHELDQIRVEAVIKQARQLTRYFNDYQFRRIVADRDIRPEKSSQGLIVQSNGIGATNIIRAYVTTKDFDAPLVEQEMLNDLNDILRPDVDFSRITTLNDPGSDVWEIYLTETNKGRIRLSRTGSGIKTILLMLINLLIVPRFAGLPLSKYIFAFEELENNLHPAAQRRLFRYLMQKAENESCHFFITTHSNVVIDLFAHHEKAQILHVTHNGTESRVERYVSTSHGWAILDDLDIRASDILQSNSVVWVEGPSDRIYFNRWMDLWTEGRLQEGVHYQCLFYGGAVRSHFSFEDPEEIDDLVAALKINRHAIFMTDSDRATEDQALPGHATRLIAEVNAGGGYGFATQGRTIENYLPDDVWSGLFADPTIKAPPLYDNAVEFAMTKLASYEKKVKLAAKVAPMLTREILPVELTTHLDQIRDRIYEWNRIPVLTSVTRTVVAGVEVPAN
jgi:putative ATP-dependent endonuclease of the OLD family